MNILLALMCEQLAVDAQEYVSLKNSRTASITLFNPRTLKVAIAKLKHTRLLLTNTFTEPFTVSIRFSLSCEESDRVESLFTMILGISSGLAASSGKITFSTFDFNFSKIKCQASKHNRVRSFYDSSFEENV